MVNERAIALDNITSKNKKYKKLSDGTVIGVDILNDLSKYAELNLKRSYKIDISKWVVHQREIRSESTQEVTNEIMRSLLQGKYKDNELIINKNDGKAITDDLDKFVILDDTSLIEKYKKYVTFNSIIVIKNTKNEEVFLTPSIYDNDDPKEIAEADNDLMILNKIFKDKYSKSIDDMVLNSFYKEINDKLDNFKNIILEESILSPQNKSKTIKQFIKDDIYNKLFALYDIKNYTIINASAREQTKDEIDDRSEKLSSINNYVKGGAGINQADIDEIIRMFKKNFKTLNKVIREEIPTEVKEKIFKKDIEAIKGIINEISSQVKDLNDTGNDAKSSKLYEQMLDKKEENIQKLVGAYETYKSKIINNIDDNINLKNEKSHLSKTFYESSDLDKLKYDTSRDKYTLLFNYIESLKDKRKTGGALEKDDKKEKNNVNTNYMRDAKSRLDIFKNLQRIYIELVTDYYEIIDDPGEEENHINFLYYDLNIDDEKTNVKNHLLKILKKYNDNIYHYIEDLNKIFNEDKITNIKSSTLLNKIKDYHDNITPQEITSSIGNRNDSIRNLFEKSFEIIGGIIKENTIIPESTGNTQTEDYPINDEKTIDDLNKYIAEKNFDDIMSQLKSEIDKMKQEPKDTDIDEKKRELANETNISKKKTAIAKRIKTLEKVKSKISKSLKDLYSYIIKIRSSNLSENEDYVITLLKSHKLSLFEHDQDSNNHPILKSIKNEIEILNEIKIKNEEELNIIEKERKATTQKGMVYGTPYNPLYQNSVPVYEKGKSKNGGGVSNKNEHIYNESRQNDLDVFKARHQEMYNLIKVNNNSIDTKEKYNFGNLMSQLKNDNKYFEAQAELNNKNTNKINPEISSEKSNIDYAETIYETIWKDYNESLGIGANKASIALSNINSNESLHNKVIVNNLDPELVLKINFQDKAIFLLLVFIIRTISVVILEFLIEHNIIKTLRGSIVFYGFTYMFILFLVVFLVNYDSYKLRILLNYLNIHINASNLILQNILFIIFITLIFILVKSDDILKYFGTVFDYTNIYGSLYDYRSSFDEESDTNLSHSEKLKLLYRTDILSMIIFIFTGFLVLIL